MWLMWGRMPKLPQTAKPRSQPPLCTAKEPLLTCDVMSIPRVPPEQPLAAASSPRVQLSGRPIRCHRLLTRIARRGSSKPTQLGMGVHEVSVCGVVCVVWCRWCGVRGVVFVVWCGVHGIHSVVWCSVVWCSVVWCGVVWCGVVWWMWCAMVWCGVGASFVAFEVFAVLGAVAQGAVMHLIYRPGQHTVGRGRYGPGMYLHPFVISNCCSSTLARSQSPRVKTSPRPPRKGPETTRARAHPANNYA